MSSSYVLLPPAVQILIRIPFILVGIAGVVLFPAFRRRLGGLAAGLGATGSALFVVYGTLFLFWIGVFIPDLPSYQVKYAWSTSTLMRISDIFGVSTTLLSTVALALIVLTAVVRRPAALPAGPAQAFPTGPGQAFPHAEPRPGP